MGAAEARDVQVDIDAGGDTASGERLSIAPDAVEVRRNPGVAAVVGLTASAVAIAYFARAAGTGAVLDWAFALGMGTLGVHWLVTLLDARTPLLVADAQGIRIRLGRTWRGLPWSAVRCVEHEPRRGLVRDGKLVVVPHNLEVLEADLDRSSRRQIAVSRALYGAPLAVPLGLTTRVDGAGEDLSAALEQIAAAAAQVVVVDPDSRVHDERDVEDSALADSALEDATGEAHAAPLVRDPRPRLAALVARVADALPRRTAVEEEPEDQHESYGDVTEPDESAVPAVVASATPAPLREPNSARREEVHREIEAEDEHAGRELSRPGMVSLVEDTVQWGDRIRPIARPGEPVEPIVLDDFAVEPAQEPVIGPELAAARTRLGLSVDQLADRTRIRPHVIEAIEVDDFAPCGGDFYARGHLRTLARVLGVDAAGLLSTYDERYAHAPISPRRVFEAELATGAHGSIRGTRGGPNWSVLVAVVMALVLCWSIARLVMDSSTPVTADTPVLDGSGGPLGGAAATLAEPVEVTVSAPAGGARVVVRDGAGEIVWRGSLTAGGTHSLKASPPLRVSSTYGAVTVAVAGAQARPVGEPGIAGQGTFVAP